MLPNRRIVFLGNIPDLTEGSYSYRWVNFFGSAKDKPTIKKFPQLPGGVLTRSHLEPRKILLEGYVTAPTQEQLYSLMDGIKNHKGYDVIVGAAFPDPVDPANNPPENRFWDCVLIDVKDLSKRYRTDFIENRLMLEAPAGYGYSNVDRDLIPAVVDTSTGVSQAVSVVNCWRGLPTITLTFSAADAGEHTVTIGNTSIGQQMDITTPLSAGDIIVVDSLEREMTLNGAPIDGPGGWPYFRNGETLSIDSDLGATFSVVATYRSTWM